MKKLSLFLALAAVLTVCITSCGDKPQDKKTDSGIEQTSETEVSGAETEEPRIPLGLADTDLDGFVMTMFQSSDFFNEKGIYAEEIDGDPVNDSIYERNSRIMEKYNCSIEQTTVAGNNTMSKLGPLIRAGDDGIDLSFERGQDIAGNFNLFVDMNTLENFDFDEPWWYSDFNRGVNLMGHLYFTMGAHMISARNAMCAIINKDLAANYNVDVISLYDSARNGEWTIDKFGAIVQIGNNDVNGDGKMDENDQWGLLGENYDNWTLALGSGFRTVLLDEEGIPVYNFACEKNVSIIDKVFSYTNDKSIALFAQRMKNSDPWGTFSQMGANGQYMFRIGTVSSGMRSHEHEYGILPVPKFDESQERYYHDGSLGNNRQMVIPLSSSDPDTVAFIVEAMAYYSYYDVLPIYYEDNLNNKVLRDEESIEMLQIVQNSLYYDIGAFFDWGDMRMTVENLTNPEKFTSQAAKMEKKVITGIEKTIAKLENP